MTRAGAATDESPGRWAAVARHRHRLLPLAVLLLLAQMAFAMVTTALAQTPTTDEPVYIGTATVQLREHSLRFNAEHPPLGKQIIEAGLVFARPRLEPGFAGDHWALGKHVLYEAGNDPDRLLLLARLPVILLTLAFGLVVLAFARDLAGWAGGLVALGLYTFSPDLIAHGSLATLDVPAAGFLVTSAWLVWRARDRPRRYLPLAGVALGAALATKMSVLPAVPVLLVLVFWGFRGRWRRGVLAAVGVGLVAVAVVWLSYLAVDPRLRFTSVVAVPEIGGLRGLLVALLPFPEPFRDGMRIQFGFEDSVFDGYLFGRWYQGSHWYYLPAALLVKTPLGMLALGVAGVVAVARLRTPAPYVLAVPLTMVVAATQGSRDFGVRYVIFVPMFLAVAAGTVVLLRRRWVAPVASALVVAVAVSSVRTFPYYLPYSNEAFGGPAATSRWLHDSNVDWGQDLGRVAEALRTGHPGEPVWLVYQGNGLPSYYGITARDPLVVPPEQVRGLLVVSNSWIAKSPGYPRLRALLESSTPVEVIGHSITIFRR